MAILEEGYDYYDDDLEVDIGWFEGLGVKEKYALEYIKYMLDSKPNEHTQKKINERLKLLETEEKI